MFDLPSHSHGQFAKNDKNETNCQIFFIVFIPKWQTFRANVMSSLKTLNINYQQVQGLSVQLKNGRLEVLELLALFLLKTETCDVIFGLVKIGFEKRGTNQSEFDEWTFFNLTPHSA